MKYDPLKSKENYIKYCLHDMFPLLKKNDIIEFIEKTIERNHGCYCEIRLDEMNEALGESVSLCEVCHQKEASFHELKEIEQYTNYVNERFNINYKAIRK